jgi:hypothetical protein
MRNHNPVKRASIAPVTPKKAIAAMCASCMGCTKDHIEEGFKNEIRNCSAQACSLYSFRPYKMPRNIPPQ